MSKILLVEDDKDIIENLSAVLRAEGFQVRAEEGQKEALQAVEEESFDLLQNILEESGELKARVPYYDLVTTQFSEEALK